MKRKIKVRVINIKRTLIYACQRNFYRLILQIQGSSYIIFTINRFTAQQGDSFNTQIVFIINIS